MMTGLIRLFGIIVLMIFSTVLMAQHTFQLAPKQSKELTNHAFWTINATCNVHGVKNKGKIKISILNNKGKVNGLSLKSGQATSFSVHENQKISVSAEPGTRVNLINLGNDAVRAECS